MLSQGKVSLVDDDDFLLLSQFKWSAQRLTNGMWRAYRGVAVAKYKRRLQYMHRLIMDVDGVHNIEVDHINRDSLDNRHLNLRLCSKRQNQLNTLPKAQSGYKGVHKHKDKWRARIKTIDKSICLGLYIDPIEAARIYDQAAIKYHGEFALLNFPNQEV